MISDKTLTRTSNKEGVSWGVIEKDYFITLLLQGLSNNKYLKENWVFKGGTAIRKTYFKNYRYSEDLDFTSITPINRKEIEKQITRVFSFLKEKENADFRSKSFHHKKGFADIKIQFNGLRGGKNTIALDVMDDEKVLDKIQERTIKNPYYYQKFTIKTYSLEEILVEKIRSLLQRIRARDYYDCWYLLKFKKNKLKLEKIKKMLYKKAKHKKVKIESIKNAFTKKRIEQTKNYYEKYLAHQVNKLPKFETMMKQLQKEIENLNLIRK